MERAARFGGGRGGERGQGGGHDFSRLPLVVVEGGGGEARSCCLRRLVGEFAERGVSGAISAPEDAVTRYRLAQLAGLYDLVLVNGGGQPSQPIAWRSWEGQGLSPAQPCIGGQEGWAAWRDSLLGFALDCHRRTPIWGCILIGGKSSRMGRPKQLIADGQGTTWLERTIGVLRPLVDGLVLSGGGQLPPGLESLPRLLDIPGVAGPLTGVVAAMRWQPLVSWVVVACDMPRVSEEAVRWLLADRPLGCWGRVPKNADSQQFEPLFAWYDFRAAQLFEEQLQVGNWRLGEAVAHPRIAHPLLPDDIASAWVNVNTPEQLAALTGDGGMEGTPIPRKESS